MCPEAPLYPGGPLQLCPEGLKQLFSGYTLQKCSGGSSTTVHARFINQ